MEVTNTSPRSRDDDAADADAASLSPPSQPSDLPMPPTVPEPEPQTHQHRHILCSPPPSGGASRPSRPKTEAGDAVELTDEEYEDCGAVSPGPTRAGTDGGVLEAYLRRTEARRERGLDLRDDVTLFLLSLAPAMRRLCPEKQSWVRTKIQQLLHEAEFGATHF